MEEAGIDEDLPDAVRLVLLSAWSGYHHANNDEDWEDIREGLKKAHMENLGLD
jgi:hypothetical protein